jgi:hypothetical protein
MYAGLYTVQVMHTAFNPDTRFLVVCDVMSSTDSPDTAAGLACDANSVAARCGASAVVFSKDAGGHRAGYVTIPAGVALVVLANLPAAEPRTLTTSGGLTITTTNRRSSGGNTSVGVPNSHGRLVIAVSGAGTLEFS